MEQGTGVGLGLAAVSVLFSLVSENQEAWSVGQTSPLGQKRP